MATGSKQAGSDNQPRGGRLRFAMWTDPEGRKWRTAIPDAAPDHEAKRGVPAGPPSLEPLGLPLDIEVRLHNELVARKIFTYDDARKKRADVANALSSALKVDTSRIIDLYA